MLDRETKRKIDSARDILVGKIPDPKAQVEQITIALIYKFMDDMDTESVEMGGSPTFFTGDFEQYGWSKIFDPRLGGFDMLTLYSEAIIKMNQNPNIPQLFRDIFKNAFLPYRDPQTLKLFLKQINEFHYDHSERLGDAFEYLLSVMSSQGDAGQFRTPRHIIDFIVQVVDPKKNETVCDPACGTAGFLISSYKHILKHNTKDRPGDTLTPDEKKRLINNFVGYDIASDMVRLSLVNMYLHGFSNPRIHEYDTLTSEDKWNETFDAILANPPFMTPKGGIRPHKRFSVQAKRSEVLFVAYIAEHLNPNGRAGVIVPEGIIFQSQNAYKQLRKMLVDNYLYAVVSLPAGVFNPYSGVKTSILLMDKNLSKKIDSILFVKIAHDGYDLGAQRKPIDNNDLPRALEAITNYKNAVNNDELFEDTQDAHAVLKSKIADNGEYNLSGDRYKEVKARLTAWSMVELGEVTILNPPKSEVKNLNKDTDVSFVPMADLNENQIDFKVQKRRRLREVFTGYTYFKENDVLLAKITPCFENGKSGIVKNLVNNIGFGSTEFIVIRPNDDVMSEWIYYFISSDIFKKIGKNNMTGSAGQQRIPKYFVKSYKIPLPPLDIQKEIVAEIEGYQKIIDGARQIVENWKPTIKIKPEWEMVELGQICKTEYGYTESAKDNGNTRFIRITDIDENGLLKKDDKKYINLTNDSRKYLIKPSDLLVARTGATYGKTLHFNSSEQAIFASYLIRLNFDNSRILNKYYWIFTLSEDYQNQKVVLSQGGAQPQFNANSIVKIKIPLPAIETQKKIVSQIESEQKIIEANKKLIAMYEQKIKERIDEVWGLGGELCCH